MTEANSELWGRIYFRDYLGGSEAKRYDKLKRTISKKYPNDRVKYTEAKTDFIISLTKKAKQYYNAI